MWKKTYLSLQIDSCDVMWRDQLPRDQYNQYANDKHAVNQVQVMILYRLYMVEQNKIFQETRLNDRILNTDI